MAIASDRVGHTITKTALSELSGEESCAMSRAMDDLAVWLFPNAPYADTTEEYILACKNNTALQRIRDVLEGDA